MTSIYRIFGYLGVMVFSASLLVGFRHDANAPVYNYLFNGGLFAAYMLIHFVMMQPWYKRMVSGSPEGSTNERRMYIIVAVVTWVVLFAVHRPLPGPAFYVDPWVVYFGVCAFLLSFFTFFEFANFEGLDALLGVSSDAQSHSLSAETPLLTEGSYASVRHPLYRGAVMMCVTSLLINPDAAQLVWAIGIALTFILFIPIEERQLLKSRGDEYRAYMEVTRYRIFRGIW